MDSNGRMSSTVRRKSEKIPLLQRDKTPYNSEQLGEETKQQGKHRRISLRKSEKELAEAFEYLWSYEVNPEIAITFLGGCEEYLLTEKYENRLKKFITSILEKFNCCLITRGAHVGITKVIGDVCSIKTLEWNYGFSSMSIGILPRKFNKYGEEFKLKDEVKSSAAPYYVCKRTVSEGSKSKTSRLAKQDIQLNPFLDFYFSVEENGSTQDEVSLVSKLNDVLLKEITVPCVMILNGGGRWSLRVMYEFLSLPEVEGKIKTKPMVIILKWSGKLSNILSSINKDYKDGEDFDTVIEQSLKEYIGKKEHPIEKEVSKLAIDIKRNSNYKEMIKAIITAREKQVHFLNWGDESDSKGDVDGEDRSGVKGDAKENDKDNDDNALERLLYKAVLDAGPTDDVKLLFKINSNDKNSITKDFREKPNLAFNVMTNSILNSNTLVRVKELVEKYEFDEESYVAEYLDELYNLDQDERPRVHASEFDSKKLMHFYKSHKCYKAEKERNDGKIVVIMDIDYVMGDLSDGNTSSRIHEYMEHNTVVNFKIINASQALLINSVLFLDVNAAKLFWHCDPYHPLSNALLAYVLLNGLNQKASEVSNSASNDFETSLGYFENLMCDLLDRFFKTNKDMTEKVLKHEIPLWNNHTFLDVAGEVGLTSVFGKQGCQVLLENEWKKPSYGNKSGSRSWSSILQLTSPNWKITFHIELRSPLTLKFSNFRERYPVKAKMQVFGLALYLPQVIYLLMLLALAFYILIEHTSTHGIIEWIVLAVVTSLAVDEIRQVVDTGKGFFRNIKQWAAYNWNIFDASSMILFFVGYAYSYHNNYVSRVLLSLYLAVSCMKFLQLLRTKQLVGVYLVMISKMLNRMKMFLLVFFVSMIGYGLFMTSLLKPNAKLDSQIILSIFFRPSLIFIGETGIASYEFSNSTTVFGTPRVERASEVLAMIGMYLFIFLANILLVNLLIADFSAIHSEVYDRSKEIWSHEQYVLLHEFRAKPVLPIPFSIFENLYVILFKCCFTRGKKSLRDHEEAAEEKIRIEKFEKFCYNKLFPQIPEDVISQ